MDSTPSLMGAVSADELTLVSVRAPLLDTHRYSFVGAMPAMEVVATQGRVVVMDHEKGTREVQENVTDPMQVGVGMCGSKRSTYNQLYGGLWTGKCSAAT